MGALSQRIARGPRPTPAKWPEPIAPAAEVDTRPAWVRLAEERKLPSKVLAA